MRYLIFILAITMSVSLWMTTPDPADAIFCEICLKRGDACDSCWMIFGKGYFCEYIWQSPRDCPACINVGHCGSKKPKDPLKRKSRLKLPKDAPPDAVMECPRGRPLPPPANLPSMLGEIHKGDISKLKEPERFYGRAPLKADWKNIRPVSERILVYLGTSKEREFQSILHDFIQSQISPLSACESKSEWKPSMPHTSWKSFLRLDVQADKESIEIVNAEIVEANWHDTGFENCILNSLQGQEIKVRSLVDKFGQFEEGRYRVETEFVYYY